MENEGKGRLGCWMRNTNISEKGTKLKIMFCGHNWKRRDWQALPSSFTVPVRDPTLAAAICGCFLFSPAFSFPYRLTGGEGSRECEGKARKSWGYGICSPKSTWKADYCTSEVKKGSFYGYCPQLWNCGQFVTLLIIGLFAVRSLLTKCSARLPGTVSVITST